MLSKKNLFAKFLIMCLMVQSICGYDFVCVKYLSSQENVLSPLSILQTQAVSIQPIEKQADDLRQNFNGWIIEKRGGDNGRLRLFLAKQQRLLGSREFLSVLQDTEYLIQRIPEEHARQLLMSIFNARKLFEFIKLARQRASYNIGRLGEIIEILCKDLSYDEKYEFPYAIVSTSEEYYESDTQDGTPAKKHYVSAQQAFIYKMYEHAINTSNPEILRTFLGIFLAGNTTYEINLVEQCYPEKDEKIEARQSSDFFHVKTLLERIAYNPKDAMPLIGMLTVLFKTADLPLDNDDFIAAELSKILNNPQIYQPDLEFLLTSLIRSVPYQRIKSQTEGSDAGNRFQLVTDKIDGSESPLKTGADRNRRHPVFRPLRFSVHYINPGPVSKELLKNIIFRIWQGSASGLETLMCKVAKRMPDNSFPEWEQAFKLFKRKTFPKWVKTVEYLKNQLEVRLQKQVGFDELLEMDYQVIREILNNKVRESLKDPKRDPDEDRLLPESDIRDLFRAWEAAKITYCNYVPLSSLNLKEAHYEIERLQKKRQAQRQDLLSQRKKLLMSTEVKENVYESYETEPAIYKEEKLELFEEITLETRNCTNHIDCLLKQLNDRYETLKKKTGLVMFSFKFVLRPIALMRSMFLAVMKFICRIAAGSDVFDLAREQIKARHKVLLAEIVRMLAVILKEMEIQGIAPARGPEIAFILKQDPNMPLDDGQLFDILRTLKTDMRDLSDCLDEAYRPYANLITETLKADLYIEDLKKLKGDQLTESIMSNMLRDTPVIKHMNNALTLLETVLEDGKKHFGNIRQEHKMQPARQALGEKADMSMRQFGAKAAVLNDLMINLGERGIDVPKGDVISYFHPTRENIDKAGVLTEEAVRSVQRQTGKIMVLSRDQVKELPPVEGLENMSEEEVVKKIISEILLVSVRSGSFFSMPGIMHTVLNAPLNNETVAALKQRYGEKSQRFIDDCYRRFLSSYAIAVMHFREDRNIFTQIIDDYKKEVLQDRDIEMQGFTAEDMNEIAGRFQAKIAEVWQAARDMLYYAQENIPDKAKFINAHEIFREHIAIDEFNIKHMDIEELKQSEQAREILKNNILQNKDLMEKRFPENMFTGITKYNNIGYFHRQGMEVLKDCVMAVNASWRSARARKFREASGIKGFWGTGELMQDMVYGNVFIGGDNAGYGTAIVFSHDLKTGKIHVHGDYKPGSQGEDLVSGTRDARKLEWLKTTGPENVSIHGEIQRQTLMISDHLKSAVELELTTQDGKVHVLQARRTKIHKADVMLKPSETDTLTAQGRAISGQASHVKLMLSNGSTAGTLRALEGLRETLNSDGEKNLGVMLVYPSDYMTTEIGIIFGHPCVSGIMFIGQGAFEGTHAASVARSKNKLMIVFDNAKIEGNKLWFFNGSEKTCIIFNKQGIAEGIFSFEGDIPIDISPYAGAIFKGKVPIVPIDEETQDQIADTDPGSVFPRSGIGTQNIPQQINGPQAQNTAV